MKLLPIPILGLCVISFGSLADGIGPYQILYGDRGIETKLLSIALAPLDHDVRFSIVLTDKETGAQRRHEFDAPVPEVPEPFHMQESYYCGAPVILLSVEYPWRHNWQEVRRIMETYAFRSTDFAFIRHAPMLQPGNRLDLTWRARLDDHMGIFTAEPLQSRGTLLDDRMALAGLNAILALLAFTLAERDPHGSLYHQTGQLLDHLSGTPGWAVLYLRWEGLLLEELGYGLDLDCCAVTGTTEDLRYVSPRSGRAVSQAGAGAWSDRLLPLPACLRNADDDPPRADLLDGFKTTGFFLEHRLAADLGQSALPEARARLITLLSRSGEK